MRDHYRVVVVGGGIIGLGVAYELAKRGCADVLVLEQGYLCSGASGRNGGGIRAQWGSPENVVLARDSIRRFESLAAELRYNFYFRQGGYLFLATREEHMATLRGVVPVQNRYGVRTRVLDEGEVRALVPGLGVADLVGGAYNDKDGVLFPWPLVWGLLDASRRHGVEVLDFTRVTGVRVADGRVTGVATTRGEVRCDLLVNAAGAWSAAVAGLAGVALPNEPIRHEILATEPLKAFFDPMLVSLADGLYMSQTMRGEVVGGISDPFERPGIDSSSSLDFLTRFARSAVAILPALARVRVLRQWAGMYDVTPDARPILGPHPTLPNFVQANGFCGHGVMVSPVACALVAEMILGERPSIDPRPYSLERFEHGQVQKEGFVIG